MIRYNLLVITTLVVGGFLFTIWHLVAQTERDVVINEIAWMGTAASANAEWIELKNNTNADINLNGWTLIAADGAPSIVLTGTIAANGYYLLERTNDASVPVITADQIFAGAIGNTGEVLFLKDTSSTTIDQVDASGIWFAGDNVTKQTMSRLDSTKIATADNWADSLTSTGTPRASNDFEISINQAPVVSINAEATGTVGELLTFDGGSSTDSDGTITNYLWSFGDTATATGMSVIHQYSATGTYPISLLITDDDGATSTATTTVTITTTTTPTVATSATLVINELVSDPISGEDEWVELYNYGSTAIDLITWVLVEGGGSVTHLNDSIGPGEFKHIEGISGSLNNDGDTLSLKTGSTTIDSVSFGSWNDGNLADNASVTTDPQSLARSHDGVDTNNDAVDFKVTTTPTPAAANTITTPPPLIENDDEDDDSEMASTNLKKYRVSDVVINEFVSDPIDGEKEWVELYNRSGSTIDLTNWTLLDGSNAVTKLTGTIGDKKFLVIESPKGALNNSGDKLVIKDGVGTMIDTVTFGSWDDGDKTDNAPAAADPNSVARTSNGDDTNDDSVDFVITTTPTKGTVNVVTNSSTIAIGGVATASTTNGVATTSKLQFSEVLPNPEGPDQEVEFVELYNPNAWPINLVGWKLTDDSNKAYTFADQIIKAHDYLAVGAETSKLTLNNSTDELTLINPSGEVVDTVLYEGASEGLSYSLTTKGKWEWTAQSTPDALNIFISTTDKDAKSKTPTVIDLVDIREVESGTLITTKGVVAVEPGIMGAQYFYLAGIDSSVGAQVYSSKKDFPKLIVGNPIEVTGTVSETNGERRIKIASRSDISVTAGTTMPSSTKLAIAEVAEAQLGMLVTVSGELIEHKSANLVIADNGTELAIAIKEATEIKTTELKDGMLLEVTGILSSTKAGLRLLPRQQSDIVVTAATGAGTVTSEEMTLPPSTNQAWWQADYVPIIGIGFLAAVVVLGKYLWSKRQHLHLPSNDSDI
ncbi:MAG: lamin tail domain-containing protein [Candidatus Buchananbacteria bacterium]|nr:lamin tail domain-containing protein [Candidatus Buchananbacteria bacterium]